MGCSSQSGLDLSKVRLGSEVSPITETLTIANSYPTDAEKSTWNYFIDMTSSEIFYDNIKLDSGVEFGVIDSLVQGYKGVTDNSKKTNDLLKLLFTNYGNGKLINTDSNKNNVYIWKEDNTIIHYLMGVSMISQGEQEEISGSLTVVSEKALEQGLWPYSKGLLNAINQPDLRE